MAYKSFEFHPTSLIQQIPQETSPMDVKLEPEVILNEHFAKQNNDTTTKLEFTAEEKAKHFPCNLCQKVFFRKKNLRQHLRVHNVVKKFQCDECGLLCDDPRALKSHKVVHGNKQFKCEHCERSFARSSQLVVHLRTHTGDKPFMCEVCSMTFHDPDILRNHRKMHKSLGNFKCPLCEKVFSLFIYLKRHIRLHSGLKSFTCEYCLKSFSEAGNLRKHISTHTGEKPFMCDVCNKCFKQKKYLDVHLKIHSPEQQADHTFPYNRIPIGPNPETSLPKPHTPSIPIKNPERNNVATKMIYQKLYEQLEVLYPEEMYKSAKKLKTHNVKLDTNLEKNEENEESESEDDAEEKGNKGNGGSEEYYIESDPKRAFICGYCYKGFKNIHHLNDHERTHTGERPFSCEQCLAAFTRLSTLKKHKRVHCKFRINSTNPDDKSNIKTDDYFDNTEEYMQGSDDHQESDDDRKELTQNEVSGFSSFEQDKEKRIKETMLEPKIDEKIESGDPEKIVRGDVQKMLKDNQDDFKSMEREEGEIIIKTEKDNEETIKKEIEDMDNFPEIPISQRVSKIKEDKKLFPCDICSYDSSKSLAQLKIHRRIHTGEKPFLCQECPKAFAQVSALNVHKRTHTGEKPYSCDKCPMWFSLKRSLDRHQLTHSGERPFLCDLCTKTFSQINTLKRHRLTHFGIKPQSNQAKGENGLLKERERTFVCNHCPKSFYNVHHLNDHKLTHTGEKPFSCDLCFTSFTRLSTLKKHKVAYCKYVGSQNN